MNVELSDDIALELKRRAKDRGLTVDELVATLIRGTRRNGKRPTLAEFAENARKANLSTPYPVDTTARSREILETEYVEYIVRRKAPHLLESDGDT